MRKDCLAGGSHSLGISRRNCFKCKSIRSVEWRKTPKGRKKSNEYNEKVKHSNAYWAKAEVYKAVRSGKILKASHFKCEDCGRPASVYDHRDYLKPLEVSPVC